MLSSESLPFFIVGLFIITVGISTFLMLRIIKKIRNRKNAPLTEDSEKTINVPLIASFMLIKGLYPISTSSNSISPRLLLHENFVEYKVIFSKKRSYDEIEQIQILLGPATTNVILEFKDSRMSFAGNLNDKQKLAEVLKILKQKCRLSPKAQEFLQEYR